ncbi:hypothetical protein IAT38_001934 [Cryptococcus sp. DSM 104549]
MGPPGPSGGESAYGKPLNRPLRLVAVATLPPNLVPQARKSGRLRIPRSFISSKCWATDDRIVPLMVARAFAEEEVLEIMGPRWDATQAIWGADGVQLVFRQLETPREPLWSVPPNCLTKIPPPPTPIHHVYSTGVTVARDAQRSLERFEAFRSEQWLKFSACDEHTGLPTRHVRFVFDKEPQFALLRVIVSPLQEHDPSDWAPQMFTGSMRSPLFADKLAEWESWRSRQKCERAMVADLQRALPAQLRERTHWVKCKKEGNDVHVRWRKKPMDYSGYSEGKAGSAAQEGSELLASSMKDDSSVHALRRPHETLKYDVVTAHGAPQHVQPHGPPPRPSLNNTAPVGQLEEGEVEDGGERDHERASGERDHERASGERDHERASGERDHERASGERDQERASGNPVNKAVGGGEVQSATRLPAPGPSSGLHTFPARPRPRFPPLEILPGSDPLPPDGPIYRSYTYKVKRPVELLNAKNDGERWHDYVYMQAAFLDSDYSPTRAVEIHHAPQSSNATYTTVTVSPLTTQNPFRWPLDLFPYLATTPVPRHLTSAREIQQWKDLELKAAKKPLEGKSTRWVRVVKTSNQYTFYWKPMSAKEIETAKVKIYLKQAPTGDYSDRPPRPNWYPPAVWGLPAGQEEGEVFSVGLTIITSVYAPPPEANPAFPYTIDIPIPRDVSTPGAFADWTMRQWERAALLDEDGVPTRVPPSNSNSSSYMADKRPGPSGENEVIVPTKQTGTAQEDSPSQTRPPYAHRGSLADQASEVDDVEGILENEMGERDQNGRPAKRQRRMSGSGTDAGGPSRASPQIMPPPPPPSQLHPVPPPPPPTPPLIPAPPPPPTPPIIPAPPPPPTPPSVPVPRLLSQLAIELNDKREQLVAWEEYIPDFPHMKRTFEAQIRKTQLEIDEITLEMDVKRKSQS